MFLGLTINRMYLGNNSYIILIGWWLFVLIFKMVIEGLQQNYDRKSSQNEEARSNDVNPSKIHLIKKLIQI
jgi:hypothetical protein